MSLKHWLYIYMIRTIYVLSQVGVNRPSKIEFEDKDFELGYIAGTISIYPASDETGIDEYVAYFYSFSKTNSQRIGSTSPSGETVQIQIFKTLFNDNTSYIQVFSETSEGSDPEGVSIRIQDIKGTFINVYNVKCCLI